MRMLDVSLDRLVDVVRGISFPTAAKRKGAAPGLMACLRTTNVQENVEWDDLLYVDESYVRSPEQRLRVGDILVSMSNSLDLVGKCALVTQLPESATFGTFIAVVRPKEGVNPRYVFHAMRTPAFRAHIRRAASTTTNISNINASKLNASTVPLFGAGACDSIASKVDELFSEIDEGERALQRVGRLVQRYRQSVLKAAVTGELTREWRERQPASGDDAASLLERIGTSRRSAALRLSQRYVEPLAADASELATLSPGWRWVTVEQLCFVETGATPKRGAAKYYDCGTVSWVTSGAVNSARITEATELITELAVAETNAKVFPPGTLVVAMYGEGKTRGKVSERGIAAATNQACAALVCGHLADEVRQYVRLFFEKHYEELRDKAAGGVQPNLNLSIIKQTALPLPPLAEIRVICDRVATRLSDALALASEVSRRVLTVSALRQSVLKAAFCGQLVPQDPRDEPASALLARPAAQDAETPAAPKRRGRPSRQPATA